jgi:hypothetical protein
MTTPDYPAPPFESQREADSDTGHSANLDAVIADYARHPEKWAWLCRAAEYAIAQGFKHLGIAAIVEDYRRYARDPRNAGQRAADFKFSNTHRAYYGRALEDTGVVPVGFVKFKRQPSKNRKPARKPQKPASVPDDPARPPREVTP